MLRDVDHAVGTVIDDRQRPLVLGGECTVVIGVISAFVRRGIDVGLVYVDGGQDLMIPADHIDEPILDGMGVAHLLGLDGVVDDIAGVGSRRPLLDPARVTFVGYSDAEEDIHGLVPSARFPASLVAESPEATAAAAIVAVTTQADKYVVHVDVDVLDFLDIPAADVPSYGRGLTLAQLRSLLGPLAADPRCVAITFVEHNPDHGSPDGSTTRALADAMADALAMGRHVESERLRRPAMLSSVFDDFAKGYLQNDLRQVRQSVVDRLDGLSEYDARRPLTATGTNLLGLVKHLTLTEIVYLGDVFGRPLSGATPSIQRSWLPKPGLALGA